MIWISQIKSGLVRYLANCLATEIDGCAQNSNLVCNLRVNQRVECGPWIGPLRKAHPSICVGK